MTDKEAIEMMKAKLECMTRSVSGRDQNCNEKKCDECNLCYEQGCMGEQKEWLRMGIKALEERQLLIIKCDSYCIPQEKLNKLRELMMKQKAEGLILLPSGFSVANVNVSLLEQIKKELKDEIYYIGGDDLIYWDDVEEIFNKHIFELEGGNNG